MSHGPCETCERLNYELLRDGGAYVRERNMSDHMYPRVRDVRERLEELFSALHHYYDEEDGFDRAFLKDVRDMMRSNCDVETAVLAAVPEPAPDPIDMSLDEFYHWLGSQND
jgi:hypothetical protein